MPLTEHAQYVEDLTVGGTKRPRVNASNEIEIYAANGTTLLTTIAGGGGGLAVWATGTVYPVGTHVTQSDRLYRCITGHTASAAFATDAANWTEVSNGASGTSGNVQFASLTGQLTSDPDFTYNGIDNILTVPNLWVTGVHRYFDPVDAPTITADVNDYAPFGAANLVGSVWAIAGDAANRALTGITAAAFDGAVLHLLNKGTHPIVLAGSNAGSAAANRFGWTGDWTLRPGESAPLIYSADLAQWAAMVPVPQPRIVEFTDSVVGALAVGDRTTPPWRCPVAGTLISVAVTAGDVLVGGSITVEVTRVSPAGFGATVDVTVPNNVWSTSNTLGSPETVAPGDLLRAEVTALTATNITSLSVQYVVRVD